MKHPPQYPYSNVVTFINLYAFINETMRTDLKASAADMRLHFEALIAGNTTESERSQRNNNYLIDSLVKRPDIYSVITDMELLKENLKSKLGSASHTYRKHIPFLPPYSESTDSIENMPTGQLIRAYLIMDALEDNEFISGIGKHLEKDIIDTSREYGGFVIFDDRNRPALNPVASAHTYPDNHLYLMPEGAADSTPHIARYHMHASTTDCSENGGPSGGTLIIKSGDIGNCYRRAMQFGEDHNLLITKLPGRKFNIDFYSGEMRGNNVNITVLDLGNYKYSI